MFNKSNKASLIFTFIFTLQRRGWSSVLPSVKPFWFSPVGTGQFAVPPCVCRSNSALQSVSGFHRNYFGFAPRCKWEQRLRAGRSKQWFGAYFLGCKGRDTGQVCRPQPTKCSLHRPASAELLLWLFRLPQMHDRSCYLLRLLTEASSLPSKLGCSPTGKLRHLIFGKEPHSHESKHSFYTTV